jgi:hypothetical protein
VRIDQTDLPDVGQISSRLGWLISSAPKWWVFEGLKSFPIKHRFVETKAR